MKINYKKALLLCGICCIMAVNTKVNAQVVEDTTKKSVGQYYTADKVIAVVGSTMVLLSDLNATKDYLEQEYRSRGYTGKNSNAEAFDAILTQKLLASQAALDSLYINEAAVEGDADVQLKSIIAGVGSISALEKMTGNPIFKIKEDLKKKVMEREMANAMQQDVRSKITISPAEVNKLYRRISKDSLPIVPEQYIYAQIAKVPPKTDDKARMDVKEELMTLRDRISKGANFAALARMYSDDLGTAVKGGEMDPQELNSLYPEFSEVLGKLKVNQLSEIVETQAGFHIIELLGKQGDLYHFRHILKRVKFTTEQKADALTQLDSVRRQILIDSLSFEDGVAKFSTDESSRQNKGVMLNTKYEMYGGPRMKTERFFKEDLDNDYPYLNVLKPGEYSPVYMAVNLDTGDELVKFVKLVKIIPSHEANLKEDYAEIEGLVKQQKAEEVFSGWLNKKIKEMYIRIEEPYKSELFEFFPRWKK